MKQLMLGNEAVARGLYEAGVRFVSSYPGTPSTEITENAAKYQEIYCEWAPNEKVAAEAAIGASFAGASILLRHEARGPERGGGPLLHHESISASTAAWFLAWPTTRVCIPLRMSRTAAAMPLAPRFPCWSLRIPQECKDFTKLAYALSEEFDTPVVLRLTTRIAHSRSLVELQEQGRKRSEAL